MARWCRHWVGGQGKAAPIIFVIRTKIPPSEVYFPKFSFVCSLSFP